MGENRLNVETQDMCCHRMGTGLDAKRPFRPLECMSRCSASFAQIGSLHRKREKHHELVAFAIFCSCEHCACMSLFSTSVSARCIGEFFIAKTATRIQNIFCSTWAGLHTTYSAVET